MIQDNGAEYGGGLAVYGGRAELNGNQIVSNQSSFHGGGVSFVSADGSLFGNIITDNMGGTGGGASLSGNITISQNTISQNSGDWGGGIALWDGNISLIGNTITNNHGGLGGGVAISYFSSGGDPNLKTIADNIIDGNTAAIGGGLFLQFARPVLTRNFIRDNSAQENGGGIYSNSSQISMDGDTVTGNTTHGNGGGLALFGTGHRVSLIDVILADNQADGDGSGLYADRYFVDIAQTTIANNRGGTGIHVRSGLPPGLGSSRVTMTNTIVASHTVAINSSVNSMVTLHGVLWFGNEVMINGAGTYSISGMIHGDPAFASGGYHLSASSAAIDSGVPSNVFHDIDLEPRPYRQFDLGADEFWPVGVLKQIYLPIASH